MPVSAQRVIADIEALEAFGYRPGEGLCRLVFTPEEMEAVRYTAGLMEAAGMTVRQDEIGNLVGRLEGTGIDSPAVIMGSHIDTVPDGGKYDGVLGVMGGIEVVRAFREDGIKPVSPIEVVVFTGEEGSRFPGYMLGSHAMAHGIRPEDLALCDNDGITLREAMEAAGLDPSGVMGAKRDPASVKAYIELHVEQGGFLEGKDLPVGIVLAIAGPLFMKGQILGRADHAGATPMGLRKDALAAAAEVILAVERIAGAGDGDYLVATVGSIRVEPGAVNVVPGKVQMSFDIRGGSMARREKARTGILGAFREICRKRGLAGDIWVEEELPPCSMDAFMVRLLEMSCRKAGVRHCLLTSGSAHDAMNMASIAPAGMILVRSRGGIGHSPLEHSTPEDIGAGVEAMYCAVAQLSRDTVSGSGV